MIELAVDRLANAVRTAAGALMVVVASAMVAVILGRYVGFVTAWADEVARIAFVWSASLGAASGTHRGLNFAIVIFAAKRQGQVKLVLETTTLVVMIALCTLVIWATTQSIPVAMLSRLPALGVSSAWFQAAITVFAVLSALFMVSKLSSLWRQR